MFYSRAFNLYLFFTFKKCDFLKLSINNIRMFNGDARLFDYIYVRIMHFTKKNILYCVMICVLFLITTGISHAMECSEDDINPAFKAICDIIIFLQGRASRAIASLTIMMSAWGIMSGGSIKWQELLQMAVGFGLFFFPKTLALFFLPSSITGISGGQFNSSTIYTPDEILSCICKAIM